MSKGLVCGVGIYEKGKYKAIVSGKATGEYMSWLNMMSRCYNPKVLAKHPTYKGCTVCDDWREFQNFARWFNVNHPSDGNKYHLDKDFKIIGNKIYSPERCLFVSPSVNVFILDRGAKSKWGVMGVYWSNSSMKFISRCRNPITGERENLGRFTDKMTAHKAWRKRKSELACELAMIQDSDEVKNALLNWRRALDLGEVHPY